MKDSADNKTFDAWIKEPPVIFKFLVYKFCHERDGKYLLRVYESHAKGGIDAVRNVSESFDNAGFPVSINKCDAYFTHYKYRENPQTNKGEHVEFISEHVINQQTYNEWERIRAISAKFA